MLLAPTSNEHPYRYARIIGVFHVEAQYLGVGSSNRGIQSLEFLLVRWFEVDQYAPFGVDSFKLPRVKFACPGSTSEAFGFVDPSQVLRAIHLIPAFNLGQVADGLGSRSFARQQDRDSNQDWKAFYVNMYQIPLHRRTNTHPKLVLQTGIYSCDSWAVGLATPT